MSIEHGPGSLRAVEDRLRDLLREEADRAPALGPLDLEVRRAPSADRASWADRAPWARRGLVLAGSVAAALAVAGVVVTSLPGSGPGDGPDAGPPAATTGGTPTPTPSPSPSGDPGAVSSSPPPATICTSSLLFERRTYLQSATSDRPSGERVGRGTLRTCAADGSTTTVRVEVRAVRGRPASALVRADGIEFAAAR